LVVRLVDVPDDEEEREDDGEDDALLHTDDDDGRGGDERHHELTWAEPVDGGHAQVVDELDADEEDHRRQDRVGHV
jgi:hypothetical protein